MVGITKKIRKFITGESAEQRKRRLRREATLARIEAQAVFRARKAGAEKFAQQRVTAENKRRLKRIAEGVKPRATGAGAVAKSVFRGLQRGVGSQSILGEQAPAPKRRVVTRRRRTTRRAPQPTVVVVRQPARRRRRSRRTRKRRVDTSESSFGLSSGF